MLVVGGEAIAAWGAGEMLQRWEARASQRNGGMAVYYGFGVPVGSWRGAIASAELWSLDVWRERLILLGSGRDSEWDG